MSFLGASRNPALNMVKHEGYAAHIDIAMRINASLDISPVIRTSLGGAAEKFADAVQS
jgi:hypothetical protein